MTTGPSTPFSLTEFQKNLPSSDQRKLLRWANYELYVAFLRFATGYEEPAVLHVGSQRHFITSISADALQTLMNNAELEEGSEIVVKTLSLAELARNAHFYSLGIHLIGNEENLRMGAYSTQILGIMGILEDLEGNEVTYEAAPFSFESIDGAEALPCGAVQYWRGIKCVHDSNRDPSELKSLYVFDDQLNWNNPLFPKLPDDAKAVSKLSPSAQAFFKRMKAPPFPIRVEEAVTSAEPKSCYQNSLLAADAGVIDQALLDGFGLDVLAAGDEGVAPPFLSHQLDLSHQPWTRSSTRN